MEKVVPEIPPSNSSQPTFSTQCTLKSELRGLLNLSDVRMVQFFEMKMLDVLAIFLMVPNKGAVALL